ncbi:glutathione S-transferase family protein [uncultured Shimia sp.]|uniref:glutathione S-transferase family protein n=1 Tax=uncultured Shimia sp. TaxID=573152 RepID=UPI0026046CA8|nr:glutathione S-transferase family protein [uncultured Shimia sp.]
MRDGAVDQVTLCGFQESIYTQVVMMALVAKGVAFDLKRDNPFEAGPSGPHPFARVPVLQHGDFAIYETAAITRYVDRAFVGISLVPGDSAGLARMDQVIAIADNYAYWPMVRRAYAHGVVRKQAGIDWDKSQVKDGLQAAEPVLKVLDEMAREGEVLNGLRISLADCQLAPMVAAFAQLPKGRKMVAQFSALSCWLEWVSQSRAFRQAVGI